VVHHIFPKHKELNIFLFQNLYKINLTNCPKIRVHISDPVSSPIATTATAKAATACMDERSLLAVSLFFSFSFSFSAEVASFLSPSLSFLSLCFLEFSSFYTVHNELNLTFIVNQIIITGAGV